MEFKGTKEDWLHNSTSSILKKHEGYYVITTKNNKVIALIPCSPDYDTMEEEHANICLIQNSLGLLTNLQRIIDRIEESELQDNFPSAFKRAKDAVNKALNK